MTPTDIPNNHPLLEGLNDPQRQAVLQTEGPVLLLSGAGSGKTKVITHRIAYLMHLGVRDYNILAITFTNKAAREMKERLHKIVGENGAWLSTFHSLCVRILRSHIDVLGYDKSFTIYDASDSQRLIKDCIKELNLSDKLYPAKSLQSIISNLKDDLYTPEAYEKEALDIKSKNNAAIFSLYQKKLRANNAVDFDDIIVLAIGVLEKDINILERYHHRFQYIMVDEYQDTNTAQYHLVNLLARGSGNLCVVGDDDQSIYGWRGANIQNILDFEKDFPSTRVIKLEQNYRSLGNILEAANCVIQHNFKRKSKSLWTAKDPGDKIQYVQNGDDRDEANFVATTIAQDHKHNYGGVAILYRKNALSRLIEEHFVRHNIPYRIFGGVRFYDRKEIKDIMSYIQCAYNPRDSVAMKRIINTPKRGIGPATIDKIEQFADATGMSFYEALKNADEIGIKTAKLAGFIELMEKLRLWANALDALADGTSTVPENRSVSNLINYIIEEIRYKENLEDDPIERQSRIENLNELVSKAVDFERSSELLNEPPTLARFLEEVSLVADIDNLAEDADYVSLMTVHSSKGLEFETVFVVGFEETIFPSVRDFSSDKELEEERRLAYVAITRAEKLLYITSANSRLTNGRINYSSPSRFLKEIPAELMERRDKKKVGFGMQEETSYGTPTKEQQDKRAISRFADVHKFNTTQQKPVGQLYKTNIPAPKDVTLDFEVGDTVSQPKYGTGTVTAINPAGADYEVKIEFDGKVKTFMANFAKITKV